MISNFAMSQNVLSLQSSIYGFNYKLFLCNYIINFNYINALI
jgi:hypothetical protein